MRMQPCFHFRLPHFGLALLCCLLATAAFAQGTYRAQADLANTRYQEGKYTESGKLYDKAFANGKPTATDYYNAACSWALAGNKEKAFTYLNLSVDKGWDNVPHFKSDKDLNSLHADPRWQPLVVRLQSENEKRDAAYNQPLKKELEHIMASDQGVRMKIDSVQKNYGMKSPQWDNLMKEMQAIDDANTKRVTAIIDQHGWPGKSLVGRTGSLAAFLVIQHAENEVQEKYFPLMKAAAEKGELSKANLALLEDRILTDKGQPQIYGSQLRQNPETGQMDFFPIADEANVDKRRAEVGLGPLSEYAKGFGLEYKGPAKAPVAKKKNKKDGK